MTFQFILTGHGSLPTSTYCTLLLLPIGLVQLTRARRRAIDRKSLFAFTTANSRADPETIQARNWMNYIYSELCQGIHADIRPRHKSLVFTQTLPPSLLPCHRSLATANVRLSLLDCHYMTEESHQTPKNTTTAVLALVRLYFVFFFLFDLKTIHTECYVVYRPDVIKQTVRLPDKSTRPLRRDVPLCVE